MAKAVALSPDHKYIITLDSNCVELFKIFGEGPFKTYAFPGLEPMGFLALYNGRVQFISSNKFIVTYEKPIGKKHFKEFAI